MHTHTHIHTHTHTCPSGVLAAITTNGVPSSSSSPSFSVLVVALKVLVAVV
jgi:hypothetical protein